VCVVVQSQMTRCKYAVDTDDTQPSFPFSGFFGCYFRSSASICWRSDRQNHVNDFKSAMHVILVAPGMNLVVGRNSNGRNSMFLGRPVLRAKSLGKHCKLQAQLFGQRGPVRTMHVQSIPMCMPPALNPAGTFLLLAAPWQQQLTCNRDGDGRQLCLPGRGRQDERCRDY
jgi:hypothetical protein